MKDYFSGHAADYARFRPGYPEEMYSFLLGHSANRGSAWDCGTGNGQVAVALSPYFDRVEATDISDRQLQQAPPYGNIHYSLSPAEKTNFAHQTFDLITVAQAVHWFDLELFYQEVKRTLKPKGIIALIGYGLLEMEGMEAWIRHFYKEVIGPYWDPERKWIDEQYQTLPFPFEEIESPRFSMPYTWTLEQLTGYLHTWSAVKHYEKVLGEGALDKEMDELKQVWGNKETRKVKFPVFMRVGKLT